MHTLKAFSVSELGYSHLEGGKKPMQDCAVSYSDDKIYIAAISDGHGSSPYFRSDRGSKFAAEVAVNVLKKLSEDVPTLSEESKSDLLTEVDFKVKLTQAIQEQWRKSVEEDYRNDPFSDTELETFLNEIKECENRQTAARWQKYLIRYKNGDDIFKVYGCTLIAVMITQNYAIGLHIGDGKCVTMYSDGKCSMPIPWDDECIANICTSLCDDEVRCRVSVFDKIPIAVFMASDGIDDTFGDGDGLYSFYRKICYNLVKNGDGYIDELQSSLAMISEKGSKDDISIAGIYDLESLTSISEVIFNYIDLETYTMKVNKLKNDLNNAQYKLKVCESNLKKAKDDVSDAESARNEAQNEIDRINGEISSISLQIEEKNALIKNMVEKHNE